MSLYICEEAFWYLECVAMGRGGMGLLFVLVFWCGSVTRTFALIILLFYKNALYQHERLFRLAWWC